MKKYIIIALVLFFCFKAKNLLADVQKPVAETYVVDNIVRFDKRIHDFGEIKQSQGAVSHTFKATNISEKAIAVLSVISSCSCTKVKWERQPLKPGETALISVIYDNSQGAYPFDKRITVFVSGISKPITLRIKGKVIPN